MQKPFVMIYLDKIEAKCSPIAHAIYIYLCKYANKEGECWPTIGNLAKCTCSSIESVKRGLKELEIFGAIEIKIISGKSNNYRILR